MKNFFFKLLLIISFFALVQCSGTGSKTKPNISSSSVGKSNLYFLREGGFVASGVLAKVNVNGIEIAKLGIKENIVHSVSGNTITLDVGISDNRVHQFQTGSSDIVKNNIIAGGSYTHTFHSATVGGVKSSTGYTISGTQITFAKPPSITDKISIKDFVTTYKANTGTKKGAELDEFNVANGVRKVFNIP